MSEQEHEQQIAKAFNAGLQMQRHEPELLTSILKSNNQKNEFLEAMANGQRQAELEKVIKEQQGIKERQQEKKRSR